MKYTDSFTQVLQEARETLDLFVPIVARVHGSTHAEFYEVEKLYQKLVEKLGTEADLAAEFTALRQVTDGYRVPEDVCESYETVYRLLSELDQAFDQ